MGLAQNNEKFNLEPLEFFPLNYNLSTSMK